jgi:hypothetical protein
MIPRLVDTWTTDEVRWVQVGRIGQPEGGLHRRWRLKPAFVVDSPVLRTVAGLISRAF